MCRDILLLGLRINTYWKLTQNRICQLMHPGIDYRLKPCFCIKVIFNKEGTGLFFCVCVLSFPQVHLQVSKKKKSRLCKYLSVLVSIYNQMIKSPLSISDVLCLTCPFTIYHLSSNYHPKWNKMFYKRKQQFLPITISDLKCNVIVCLVNNVL